MARYAHTTRTPSTRSPAAIAFAAGVLVSMVSLASAATEPNPLAGPSVNATPQGDSLIERNIDGSMRRPEVPVAEAALRTVDLDDATRAKVDALLAERAKQIDGIVKANLETLNTFRTDRQANAGGENRRAQQRERTRTLMEMFKPVLEKGPLEEQIAALMPEATRVSYLVDIEEHREVMLAERRARGPRAEARAERRGGPGAGSPPAMDNDGPMLFEDPMLEMLDDEPTERQGRPEGRRRAGPEGRPERGSEGGPRSEMRDTMIQMQTLQMEIRRSVERLSDDKEAREADLFSRLDLDAEQEGKVRDLLQSLRQSARESDDPRAARREIMQELAQILTPEQQQELREAMGRGARNADRVPRRRPGRAGPPNGDED